MEKLKVYYLDQKEITLKTGCQAIISFYNKTNSNKASRVRWTKFADAITGTGVQINIEHINGKKNTLADALLRLVNFFLEEGDEQNSQAQRISKITQDVIHNGSQKEQQLLAQMLEAARFEETPKHLSYSPIQAQVNSQPNNPHYTWHYATCYGNSAWATKGRTTY